MSFTALHHGCFEPTYVDYMYGESKRTGWRDRDMKTVRMLALIWPFHLACTGYLLQNFKCQPFSFFSFLASFIKRGQPGHLCLINVTLLISQSFLHWPKGQIHWRHKALCFKVHFNATTKLEDVADIKNLKSICQWYKYWDQHYGISLSQCFVSFVSSWLIKWKFSLCGSWSLIGCPPNQTLPSLFPAGSFRVKNPPAFQSV